jgi:arylsulfatase A-like enzyme
MEARKGVGAREVAPLNLKTYTAVEEETFKRSVDFIKRNAKGEKPFFIYYASHFVSMFTSHPDWPGIIKPNRISAELIQVTDMYTTAARIGGALAQVPRDRVIDGIEQSSYLMAATPSRRDYMFHYSGANLGAIRVGQYKRHLAAAHGGLPGKDFYDIYKDPKEENVVMAEMLWAWVPFDDIARMHNELIEKYPHRQPYRSAIGE